MNCKATRELLPAHLDQELSVAETIAIEQHLQGCPECQRELAEQGELKNAIRKHATYHAAPADLEARIRAALPQPTPPKRAQWWTSNLRWLNVGAVFATMFALAWSTILYLSVPSADELLANEVISGHVRSLMVNHIADVPSSDQHTVKPWFNGKLDFSPTVTDFTAEGFPLVGGRLDYLDRQPVAALVYRHRLHLINVYQWPAASEQTSAVRTLSRQGYHLVHWVSNGMVHWVVSDLDPRDLISLVRMLQAQGTQPGVSPSGSG